MTPRTSLTDPQTDQLLAYLWRGGQHGFVWTPNGGDGTKKRSTWYQVGEPVVIPLAWRAGKNLYFGVNPSSVRREYYQASTNDTIAAVNCLFAEFDAKDYTDPTPEEIDAQYQVLRTDPDKAKQPDKALMHQALSLAKDAKVATDPAHYKAMAKAAVDALQPAPGVVVDSGGGYQCYWLLRDTFAISSEADRTHIKGLQKRWVAFVGGDPGAADLRRVLRLPGSRNHKKRYAPDYPLVSFTKFDLGLRYNLDELARLVPETEPEPAPEAKPVKSGEPAPVVTGNYDDDESVIGAYNRAVKYADALRSAGYTEHGPRWSRPGEPESKGVEVYDSDNSGLHWSSNDPLFSEHRRRPFDVYCTFEHAGNLQKAVAAAAKLLGMEWPEVDWQGLRLWARTTNFHELLPEELRPEIYRTDGTDTKVADAVFDEMEKYGRPRTYTTARKLAKRAGVGSNTVLRSLERLNGWLFKVQTREKGLIITLTRDMMSSFRADGALSVKPLVPSFSAPSARNENEYSPRKAHDAFQTHSSRKVKEQCQEWCIEFPNLTEGLYKDVLAGVPAGMGEACLRILDALQRAGDMTAAELAEETGKKPGACWRACKRLEEHGLVESVREHSRAPKVYSLASDVWRKVEELTPTLRTAGKADERESRALRDAQRWAKKDEEEAKAIGDQEAAQKARHRFNSLGEQRIKVLKRIYPEMDTATRAALVDDEHFPQSPHPALIAKMKRRHAIARADVAATNRKAQWELNKLAHQLRTEGRGKQEAVRMMEYAGYTKQEAWEAAHRVWPVAQEVNA